MGYTNAPFHQNWYRFLQDEFSPLKQHPNKQKKYLQLWPRGHGKTTGIILYVLWLIGNYPDIHIQIVSKTAAQAESICLAIMTTIEHDQKYIDLFGNLKPDQPIKWTTQQFIINRQEISKNPTVKATGNMGPITGGRSDLIIDDDPIDEENIRTHLQIEKVETWFNKVLYPTLYPWGAIIVIGTRWSYADLYAHLIETWPHSILQAINKDGEALWPEYWSIPKLEQRKKEIGTIIFNCQYQNDPTGMEGDLLKAEWLHQYTSPPDPSLPNYAGVDVSTGDAESDLYSIATLAYDRNNKQGYLKEVYADRISFPLFLQKLKEQHNLYKYAKIFIESNAFQKILIHLEELRGLPIVPSVTVKNKEARFIPMSSHFEAQRVQISPLINHKSEFYIEWIQFPKAPHDDALDAVEIVIREIIGATYTPWVKNISW